MNTRALFRWMLSIVVAVGLLGVIGLVLNPPAQARAALVHDWPGLLPPCNTPSLQQCIDGAIVLPGDTIHIRPGVYTQSVTLAKPVSLVGDNRTTTIISALPGQRVLTVTGNLTGTTVISGLTFKRGNVGGSVCPDACGGGILLDAAARPALQGIALVENSAAWQGGGLWVAGTAEVKLVNVSFISNTSGSDGGGLWTSAATQLFNNNFERNTAGENGGGVFVSGAVALSANKSTFLKNTAISGNGGGAAVGAVAELNGGWFRENSAMSGGGLQAGSLIMTSTEWISNSAGFGGGGVSVIGPTQLQGGKFTSNTTSNGNGGGLLADALQAQFTYFSNNAARGGSIQQGGAVYLNNGPNDLDRVWFQGNEALSNGGALYATGLTTLTGVSMISNTADTGQGGGAFVNSPLTIAGGSYVDNFANVSGGGLYALSIALTGAHVDNNRTLGSGGGLHADGGPLLLIDSGLRNNVAGQTGGGVYVNGTLAITAATFISNSAAINGGGLYHAVAGDARIVNTLFARNRAPVSQTTAIVLGATGTAFVYHTTIADITPNPATAIAIDNGNAAVQVQDSIISQHAVGINLISGGTFENYNLFFNNLANTAGPLTSGGNSLSGVAPQFADPANDDYHLRFTSPAINAGINVGVNVDIDGQPRPIGPGFDIGFDETGSTIQQSIDFTPPGGVVPVPGGVYVESLNLYKPVSLIGAGSGATVIQAVAGDRVLTVTGAITSATQIANLTLTGGDVSGGGFNRAGGGALITGTAYPSFNNVQIVSNGADFGGGLYVYSGGAILNNSVVANNHANQSGGGAYVVEPAAVLEQVGGAIQNNTAFDGAGVFVQSGQFRQNGGVIVNNAASHWGGGLLIGSGGSIKTTLAQIVDNSAVTAGGGVFVDVGAAELLNSQIMSNTASEGGGLYVRGLSGTTASIVGGKIEHNAANSYGGGVYAGGTLYITGTRFFSNNAFDGSALEITGTAQARIVNAFIAGNAALGAFPSTNASVRFDSTANSVVLHTTFGNATQPLTRALAVNSGVVTVVNTIVALYNTGLSQFGGQLAEDYNLFFSTPITFSGSISHGGHSVFGLDPLFRGAPIDDYHLKGLSPAVNRGTNGGVRRDIDGEARPLGGGFDIGADEASVAGVTPDLNTGGSFLYTTTQNSTIFLDVPPGAVTGSVPIYCSLIDSTTISLPRRLKLAGIIFELDADLDPVNVLPGSINFNLPVTLSVSYTDAQLAAAGITDELTLKLYRFELLLGGWEPIGYRLNETQTLDVDHNLITATVLGLSRFGGMGSAAVGFDIFLPLVMKN